MALRCIVLGERLFGGFCASGDIAFYFGKGDIERGGQLGVKIPFGGVGISAFGIGNTLGAADQRGIVMMHRTNDAKPF